MPDSESTGATERVARVLADEFGLPFDPSPFSSESPYDRDYWMNLARAALAALQPRQDTVEAIREVLIEAKDIIPCGEEPFVGWSLVLAERIADALVAGNPGPLTPEEERLRAALNGIGVALSVGGPVTETDRMAMLDAIEAALASGPPGGEGGTDES